MKYLIVIVFVFSISISAQKGKINFELDHINVVVKDLKETEYYLNDKLGFAVKPGKLHENTIENIFIKFSDKSYIEFLTVSKAKDELSKYYLRLKKEFPGGKSVFLFLESTLRKNSIPLKGIYFNLELIHLTMTSVMQI